MIHIYCHSHSTNINEQLLYANCINTGSKPLASGKLFCTIGPFFNSFFFSFLSIWLYNDLNLSPAVQAVLKLIFTLKNAGILDVNYYPYPILELLIVQIGLLYNAYNASHSPPPFLR